MLIRSFFPVVYTVYICVRCAPLHVYPNNHQFVTNNSILHFSCFAVLHTFNDGLLLYPPFFLFLFGERNFIPFNEHWCLYHVVLCRHMNSIWSVYLSWSPLAVDNKKNITNKRKRKEKKKQRQTTTKWNDKICAGTYTQCAHQMFDQYAMPFNAIPSIWRWPQPCSRSLIYWVWFSWKCKHFHIEYIHASHAHASAWLCTILFKKTYK